MTYKSITERIKGRIAELLDNELHHLPQRFGGIGKRELFVSNEVFDAVSEPYPSTREGIQLEAFRATLDHYSSGLRMTIYERHRDKPPHTMLAKPRHPKIKDVWDFRSLAADDGVRCFGCFGGPNLFIALIWNHRQGIDFEGEAEACMRAWDRLFPGLPPFNGDFPDGYGTNFKDY